MSRRTLQELREAVRLLHNRGQLAWMQLAEWKAISDYIALRPEIFQTAPAFWQTTSNSLLDVALLSLLDLIHPSGKGSLSLPFLLNIAEDRAASKEWPISGEDLKAAVQSDRSLLAQWQEKTQGAKEYRDKKLAHYDTKHIGNALEEFEIGVVPSVIRDSLYDCSRILNRYSHLLEQTTHTWTTDDLHHFERIGRLLELGFDSRSALLNEMESLEGFRRSSQLLDAGWEKVGRVVTNPYIERDQKENLWRWNWLERYKRDFQAGRWPA